MKQINPQEVLQRLRESQPHVERTKPATLTTAKTISQLWNRMARIYGHKWTSIAECDDGTWQAGLQDLAPEMLAIGLGVLLKDAREWPPSLPEFREMCLGGKDESEWQQKTKAYIEYSPQIKLAAPKNRSLAKEQMQEIKRKLNQ